MNAIMIVLVPARDGEPVTEQAGAGSLEVWQWRIDRQNENADRGEMRTCPRRLALLDLVYREPA